MIDPGARSSHPATGRGAGDQPQHGLLPAASGLGRRPVADAAHRRAAHELSVRRQPHAARHAQPARSGGGPPPRPHADAADGDRGASIAGRTHRNPRQDTGFIPTCCAAWPSRGPIKSGPWTSRTSPWRAASSIWPRWSTGSAAACWRGGCRSPWTLSSASKRWKKPFQK